MIDTRSRLLTFHELEIALHGFLFLLAFIFSIGYLVTLYSFNSLGLYFYVLAGGDWLLLGTGVFVLYLFLRGAIKAVYLPFKSTVSSGVSGKNQSLKFFIGLYFAIVAFVTAQVLLDVAQHTGPSSDNFFVQLLGFLSLLIIFLYVSFLFIKAVLYIGLASKDSVVLIADTHLPCWLNVSVFLGLAVVCVGAVIILQSPIALLQVALGYIFLISLITAYPTAVH